jgi:glycosyltransferase involved in cell wall biosynthesis
MTLKTHHNGTDVLVFIPAYNDLGSVDSVVRDTRRVLPGARILVIDDGSIDDGGLDPDALGILFVELPANFGLGVCTHIAFDYALGHGFNTMIRIDADEQHPIDDSPHLLEPLANDAADIVVGCRANRDERHGFDGWARSLVTRYFSLLAKFITTGRVPSDINSGFFALNRNAMETLNRHQLERYPEPQMFILATRNGLRIKEVSVVQSTRRHGKTSLNLFSAARFFYRFNIFILGEILRGRRS